jgi:hypothetical protein
VVGLEDVLLDEVVGEEVVPPLLVVVVVLLEPRVAR